MDDIAPTAPEMQPPGGPHLESPQNPAFPMTQDSISSYEELARRLQDLEIELADMRQAQRIAHFANWSWTPATGAVTWSEELFRIAGLAPAQGPPSFAQHLSLFSQESWAALSLCVEKALKDGQPYFLEMEILRPDGEVRSIWNFGEVVKNREGYLDRLVGVVLDVTDRKKDEEHRQKSIDELELRVAERTNELQRKNIALAEVLQQVDIEKQHLENKVHSNIKRLLVPVIDRLIEKSTSIDSRYLKILKQNLQELTSSQGINLSSPEYRLTAKEAELCALIKGGFTIKEIAIMQGLSERTVETRRYKIRKKLRIFSRNTSLTAFLAGL